MQAGPCPLEAPTRKRNEPQFLENDQATRATLDPSHQRETKATVNQVSDFANDARTKCLNTASTICTTLASKCDELSLLVFADRRTNSNKALGEDARATAFEAPWEQNIPSAPLAGISVPVVGGVPALDQLHAVLVQYNQRLDDGYLPHLFFERLLQSIELYVQHCPLDMAHVLGAMTTGALNAHDAYAKASRSVYFWCIAVTPQLDVLHDLLENGHLDDARTVLRSGYDGSADTMDTAVAALATTQVHLRHLNDNVTKFISRCAELVERVSRVSPCELSSVYAASARSYWRCREARQRVHRYVARSS